MPDTEFSGLQILGRIRSDFSDRFGIPRQPGLVPSALGELVLLPPFDDARLVEGLDAYSHLWLTFIFHATAAQGWRPRVRPPRLGGNRRLGVFATRSPFRPNHLGLSAVRLDRVEIDRGVRLHLSGVDLLDGTPVVDIRPYLPYADRIEATQAGFAAEEPARLPVDFLAPVTAVLSQAPPRLGKLIAEVLSLDPRPAYQDEGREYGLTLAGWEVRFRVCAGRVVVREVRPGRPASERG